VSIPTPQSARDSQFDDEQRQNHWIASAGGEVVVDLERPETEGDEPVEQVLMEMSWRSRGRRRRTGCGGSAGG
jgi:hypothetical protein